MIAAVMIPTYFIDRPNPIVLTRDGRINFLPFEMIPDTIVVNGFKGLVRSDGLSVMPIKELVNLGYLQPNAGTPVDPLRVQGKLMTGKHQKTVCLKSCTPFTEFASPSRFAHVQKVDKLAAVSPQLPPPVLCASLPDAA